MSRKIMLSLLLVSLVVTASAQLSPVYTPDGEGGDVASPPSVVEVTPVVVDQPPPTPRPAPSPSSNFVTKTVYGFLDFTTVVGNTVMIFTPQSQSGKPSATETRVPSPASRSSHHARPSSRFTPSPTPTLARVTATPAPSTLPPRASILPSSTLESSFFEPHTPLAIEELFSRSPQEEIFEEELPEEKVEVVAKPTRSTPPFRRPFKPSAETTGNRRRLDLNYFANRKKPASDRRFPGGSTIVPITVEGTGKLTQKTKVTQEPLRSPVFITTPSEVVVSATQGFASLSVIGPFSTAVNNELGQVSEHYDFLSSSPTLNVQEEFDVFEVEPTAKKELYSASLLNTDNTKTEFPTGLVTKLGGTIVSDGLTTVHETSVIGTYIKGQYAQVLMSTSHIFQVSLAQEENLNSPSLSPDYETIKSVIKGSATQFITPETTSALPLESLFSVPVSRNRDSRRNEEESLIQARLRSALSKRRGSQQNSGPRSRPMQDPYADEEEDHDLQRAGSNLRPSFRFQQTASLRRTPEVSTFYAQSQNPTTVIPRYKSSATRRFSGGRQTTLRPTPPGSKRTGRPSNRWRLGTSPRPKVNINRRPIGPADNYNKQQTAEESVIDSYYRPTPEAPILQDTQEETIRVVTSTPADGPTDVWLEVKTIRSLHTFRVGTTKNTRYVTFTKTLTHSIDVTPDPTLTQDELYETPLFENILNAGPRDVSTLPPVDLGSNDISVVLETVTETFSTTDMVKKTSVLPVLQAGETFFHTLTQTYHITRVVTALKTMPPYEAFSFIPENSLNEFNGQLLAEGTENEEALLPGEVEYDENGEIVATTSETRVRPPPGFPIQDPDLAELAGGEFNPDVFEKQLHPQLAAALEQRQQQQQQQQKQQQQQQQQSGGTPQLTPGQLLAPAEPAVATPQLTPEQLQQLAYLRLMNPYGFGGFPPVQPQTTVTSSPVTITTDLTTTSTRVFRVIFNARPIMTTISSVEVVHTTLTTYSTATITVTPTLSPFSFPFPPSPFPVG
ncbi:flocculation protein FLO11-like isoform X2 [Homarus americanus]|uniref:flocculation protein FLO11-like isoform X2 n=1 Tax=Homarus americanus TaxID=6706 RepID=UPI001C461B3B|nr:flocculation protein FLO11-like isoform X2 [Homarus americanus]